MGGCIKPKGNADHNKETSEKDSNLTVTVNTAPDHERQRGNIFNISKAQLIRYQTQNAIIIDKPKTDKEKCALKAYFARNPFLSLLPHETIETTIEHMLMYSFKENEIVFKQQDSPHSIFMIETGSVEFLVDQQRILILETGCSFGESEIIHNSKRTSTAVTVQATSLWAIDQVEFNSLLKVINNLQHIKNEVFMDNINWFQVLDIHQKEAILNMLVTTEFQDGESILIEEDSGNSLLIVKEGEIVCSICGIEIIRIKTTGKVGKQPFLYALQRMTTVRAIGKTKIIFLRQDPLDSILESGLKDIVYRNLERIAIEKSKVLRKLTQRQIEFLTSRMKVLRYRTGDVIVSRNSRRGEHL